MTNGKEESDTLSRLNKFEEELDNYNKVTLLSKVQTDPETEKALNFTIDQLNGMAAVDLAIYAYKLQCFSLYVQKQYNRSKNLLRWANHNLSIITAKESKTFARDVYMKYEEKRTHIAVWNSYGVQLNKIILDTGARMEELDQLSHRVGAISKALSDIQNCKRYNNNG